MTPRTTLEVEPLSDAIGANVRGLDLRRSLADEDREALLRALDEHLALFFRNQPLSREQFVDFGSGLGPLDRHAFAPTDGEYPEIVVLDQLRPVPGGSMQSPIVRALDRSTRVRS